MNYRQAKAYHREVKKYGSILGLDNIKRLMYELGDVWKSLNIIHVAGTNGKGSVCCFLASMLKEAQYKTGWYSSPAVFSLREVYKVNGKEISEDEYGICMEQVKKACDAITAKGYPHPTVFEIETALAFCWFAKEECDVVILEVGMGGGEDATNLITRPLCSVITSISRDHMKFLGDSIAEIAKAKAGIIKEGCPVVTIQQKKEAEEILNAYAKEKHAPYYVADSILKSRVCNGLRYFTHPVLGEVQLSMSGFYQLENASLAIEVMEVLKSNPFRIRITQEQMKKGLKNAYWPGRFECLCREPLFFIDGAHNLDGAAKLKETLIESFSGKRKIGIMGVMEDKEYESILHMLLPLFSRIYTVTPDNPRALSCEKLKDAIISQGGKACACETVKEAVALAYEKAEKESGMVMVFGSLYYLNEVKNALQKFTGDEGRIN